MPGPVPPSCVSPSTVASHRQHTPRPPVASSREGCRPRPVPPQGAQPMEWHTAFWSGCALANGFQEPTSHMCTLRSSPAEGNGPGPEARQSWRCCATAMAVPHRPPHSAAQRPQAPHAWCACWPTDSSCNPHPEALPLAPHNCSLLFAAAEAHRWWPSGAQAPRAAQCSTGSRSWPAVVAPMQVFSDTTGVPGGACKQPIQQGMQLATVRPTSRRPAAAEVLPTSPPSCASLGVASPASHAQQAQRANKLTDTPPSCAFHECLAAISRSGPRVAVREGSHTAGRALEWRKMQTHQCARGPTLRAGH